MCINDLSQKQLPSMILEGRSIGKRFLCNLRQLTERDFFFIHRCLFRVMWSKGLTLYRLATTDNLGIFLEHHAQTTYLL